MGILHRTPPITGCGLDCYRLPTAPPCPPSHKELHCMVGSVSCALVRWLGMSLMWWGTDPQTPDFMYFYVFIVIQLEQSEKYQFGVFLALKNNSVRVDSFEKVNQ